MKIGNIIEFNEADLRGFGSLLKDIYIRLKLPRNKPNKLGIVIAIKTENDVEKKKLQNNLLVELNTYLSNSRIPPIFNVIELGEKWAQKINDGPTALSYLRRVRGHFMVYGQMLKGKMKNGQVHYKFRLEGAVIHRPIERFYSDQLSKEFTELLSKKVTFPEDEELLGFEFTQQWLGVVTKYIIGIAAFLSGDLDLSFDIYNQLDKELKNIQEAIPAVIEIKRRLPKRIYEVALGFTHKLYYQYTKTRQVEYIKRSKIYLDLLLSLAPNDYTSGLQRAIYYFLIERDISRSKKELDRVKDNPFDLTWRYSMAFLLAYEERLMEAKKQYDKIVKGYSNGRIICDCERFINDILDAEPNKYGLYFLRGYLNFKIKLDLVLAKKDFEDFLAKSTDDTNKEARRLVGIYLGQINKDLSG